MEGRRWPRGTEQRPGQWGKRPGQEECPGGQLRDRGTEVEGSSERHGVHVPTMRARW